MDMPSWDNIAVMLVALTQVIGIWMTWQMKTTIVDKVDTVHHQMNSMQDKLVKATGDAAFAEGKEAAEDEAEAEVEAAK